MKSKLKYYAQVICVNLLAFLVPVSADTRYLYRKMSYYQIRFL